MSATFSRSMFKFRETGRPRSIERVIKKYPRAESPDPFCAGKCFQVFQRFPEFARFDIFPRNKGCIGKEGEGEVSLIPENTRKRVSKGDKNVGTLCGDKSFRK